MVRRELDNEIRDISSFYEKLCGDRLSKLRESLMIPSLGIHP